MAGLTSRLRGRKARGGKRKKKLTFATKEGRQVPELSHIESLKHLALVTGTIAVQDNTGGLAVIVLVGKG